MSDKFEKALKSANTRLRNGRIRVAIEVRRSKLVLRATLPPKAGSARTEPYQQRISTGENANMLGLSRAEAIAKKVGADLATGDFDWADHGFGSKTKTCGYWIEKLEAHYWLRRTKTTAAINTWRSYSSALNQLPTKQPLTIEILTRGLEGTKPDSRARQRYCQVYVKLAKFAGLDHTPLNSLSGNYGLNKVEARELPSKELIIEVGRSLSSPAWRWVFGMMATYGLRPHEVFGLDLSEFPVIYTHPRSKTGKRFVYAVPPDWVDLFELITPMLPNLSELSKGSESWDNSKLGTKVSQFFRKRGLPFNAYSLRHCYARHCFELGMRADLAAKLMGHSLETHTEIYRNFWAEETFREEYQRLMDRNT